MKYNFSDRARAVLRQANLEAEAVGHDYIGTEHILLGLLGQTGGPANQILAALGVEAAAMRHQVLQMFRPGNSTERLGARPYTSRAKKVLELAMASSREMNAATGGAARASLDTEHLLMGLVLEEKGIAAKALEGFGVTPEAVTRAASRLHGMDVSHSGNTDRERRGPLRGSAISTPDGSRDSVWFVQIEPDSGTPIYEQIIAGIEEAVATNLLLPGERLPAVRDLAAELSVAPGTVARAYSSLEQRGVLATEGARGTRVAERPPQSRKNAELLPALADLLRPVAVAAYHMGARAQDVHAALESAMQDIFLEARD